MNPRHPIIRSVENIQWRYGCSVETAQRYCALRDEGYPAYQALVLCGLADPPEPEEGY